jgi:DNA replication protein DnaC
LLQFFDVSRNGFYAWLQRVESRFTIVTSQLLIEEWQDVIGDAIPDRLARNAYKINLRCESM